MIKKFIGLILVLIIFYFAIKALVFLPALSNLVIGPNKSPFQIGTDYVDQINAIYPYNQNAKIQTKNRQVTYASNTRTNIVGKVTLEKSNGKLILSVESANPKTDLNIWLTNNPEITSETEYVDFGKLVKSESIKQYVIDMKGGDISFAEYNNILIVDANYKLYARIPLK